MGSSLAITAVIFVISDTKYKANVGRFTELVRELSSQTQFIITHSKKTMGMAPVLYGVTMQEPGVSKLVSVRFHEEDAKLVAASA